MITLKSAINRLICFTAALIILLLAGQFFLSCEAVSDGSVTLFIITSVIVFFAAVKAVSLYTGLGLKNDSQKISEYIIPVFLMVILSVAIRGFVFILVDFPIFDAEAFITYFYGIFNTFLVFFISWRLWGKYSALAATLVYTLCGMGEVFSAMNSKMLGSSIYQFRAAEAFALLGVLFMFCSVSAQKHNISIVFCIFAGIFVGGAVALEFSYVILFLCAITYYLLAKSRLREKKIWTKKPAPISNAFFIGMFTCFSIFCFILVAILLKFFGVEEAFSGLRSFSVIELRGVFDSFKEFDEVLASCIAFIKLPRNYFVNYLHGVTFLVILLCAAFGAFTAAKKNDLRAVVLSQIVLLLFVYMVIGTSEYVISLAVPFLIMLAIYGMNSVAEFFAMFSWFYRGGVLNPAFTEKYVNPKSMPIKAVMLSEKKDRSLKKDSAYSADSESVAKGADQDSLLNSLAEKAHK